MTRADGSDPILTRLPPRRTERSYRPGRAMTTFGEPAGHPVLLWHGRGPNERDVLDRLASTIAGLGACVFVPDWDSMAPDGGAADLAASLEFALLQSTRKVTVVGWSLGGTAATGLAFGTHATDLPIRAVVGLAIDPRARDRVSGLRVHEMASRQTHTPPVTVLHGVHDVVVPINTCVEFVDRMRTTNRTVKFEKVETDHAGIVGTAYNVDTRRCAPANSTFAQTGLRAAVRAVTEVLVT